MYRKKLLIRIGAPAKFVEGGGICVWFLYDKKAFTRKKDIPVKN